MFLAGFVAATILPASSEVLLLALFHQGYDAGWLWLAATLGNTAGSCLNWVLGRYAASFQDKRWFPVDRQQLERASVRFQRYGVWSLLLAWLPVVGDPLTVVAGVLNVRFRLFIFLVFLGKGGRYLVLLWVASKVV